MIPKKIHYCWFGGNPYPPLVEKCINSWKKNMPDYELVEWNESTFDIESNAFVKEAFEAKKYAFVSDYVRLFALYNLGGIYMDTDVEVIKPLTPFLHLQAFTGREGGNTCVTGTMGSVKGHLWIKALLDYYNDRSFLSDDGMNTNTKIITEITHEMFEIKTNVTDIFSSDELTIFPFEYFCAKDFITGKVIIQNTTYTIHHYSGSWLTTKQKRKNEIVKILRKITGPKIFKILYDLKNSTKNIR
ncbi:glycosyl transferase [Lysinibacillus fusiformis]|nr:glycosyl transferase [Lysinibacillus fusiformis]